MAKIKMTDTVLDVLFNMSEGNPGALRVCSEILRDGARIDPDDMLGGAGVLMRLDTLGVYGPRIWMLFKDVCGQSLETTLAMLRAQQLGYVSGDALRHAIDNRGDGLDVEGLEAQVRGRLPNFGGVAAEVEAEAAF